MVGNPIGKCNLLWPVLSERGTIRQHPLRHLGMRSQRSGVMEVETTYVRDQSN
ncbi:hypothetical protein [Xenorhabdus bovienii]|uniref:hypothetical protein n=1 Tax=Xenorhabdus bovienii TaxID=40576 RepID=UPI0023B2DF39|nr:hypothetical protein [Xenorhabdus bovienii]